jgi:hypothetical protein
VVRWVVEMEYVSRLRVYGMGWGCAHTEDASVDASSGPDVDRDRESPGHSGNRVKLFQPATTL